MIHVNKAGPRDDIDAFLEGLESVAVETVAWRGGQLMLENSVYLTTRPAPDRLITSGRCLILAGESVLVMTNPGGTHILPGGRREPGETPIQAVTREVLEETGLHIVAPQQIAVLVYRHLTPRPALYAYPYPCFVNTVYVASNSMPAEVVVNDTYELAGEFLPIAEALTQLPAYQQILLRSQVATPTA